MQIPQLPYLMFKISIATGCILLPNSPKAVELLCKCFQARCCWQHSHCSVSLGILLETDTYQLLLCHSFWWKNITQGLKWPTDKGFQIYSWLFKVHERKENGFGWVLPASSWDQWLQRYTYSCFRQTPVSIFTSLQQCSDSSSSDALLKPRSSVSILRLIQISST